jgi:hypothetical protein
MILHFSYQEYTNMMQHNYAQLLLTIRTPSKMINKKSFRSDQRLKSVE